MPALDRPFIIAHDDLHYLVDLSQVTHLARLFETFYPDGSEALPGWERLTPDEAPVHIWTNGIIGLIPGTNSLVDWLYNLDVRYRTEGSHRYHKGFYRATKKVAKYARHLPAGIPIVSHSFGSAVATLLPIIDYAPHKGRTITGLATPNLMGPETARRHGLRQRCGTEAFTIHVLAADDIVTKAPPWMARPGVEVLLPGARGINDHSIGKYHRRLNAIISNHLYSNPVGEVVTLPRDACMIDLRHG